jgi:hypothetical protein
VPEYLRAAATLLWPLVVAFSVLRLLPTITRLLRHSDRIELEVGGNKITVQRASDELRSLISDLQDRINQLESASMTATSGPTHTSQPIIASGNLLLWVDDRVEANVYERARLAELGIRVVQAESTRSALRTIHDGGPFSAIISDMARVEDGGRLNPTAGLDLLREIRGAGNETPVVFYSSSRSLDGTIDRLEGTANTSYTSSPSELMRLLGVSGEA